MYTHSLSTKVQAVAPVSDPGLSHLNRTPQAATAVALFGVPVSRWDSEETGGAGVDGEARANRNTDDRDAHVAMELADERAQARAAHLDNWDALLDRGHVKKVGKAARDRERVDQMKVEQEEGTNQFQTAAVQRAERSERVGGDKEPAPSQKKRSMGGGRGGAGKGGGKGGGKGRG